MLLESIEVLLPPLTAIHKAVHKYTRRGYGDGGERGEGGEEVEGGGEAEGEGGLG